jgi:hypothetical protein
VIREAVGEVHEIASAGDKPDGFGEEIPRIVESVLRE